MPASSTLILRPGALGDAVLTLPVLQALRAAGTQRIVILGTPASWGWLRPTPDVALFDWTDPEWLALCTPDGVLPSSASQKLEGVGRAVVYLRSGADQACQVFLHTGVKRVLAAAPPTWPEHADDVQTEQHASEQLLEPVRAWTGDQSRTGVGAEHSREPLLTVRDDERTAALQRLGLDRPPSDGFFAIHPGSGGRSKCWPADRYVELLQRAARDTGLMPLVFLGPVETETGNFRHVGLPVGTMRAVSFPLREVLALLSLSRVFVGNDAGVTHLAARCCPTLQLFGATRSCRWKALGPEVTAIEAPGGVLERLPVEAVWERVLAFAAP